jgi:hypothetical protein
MRERFIRFREVYEFTRERLVAEGAAGHVIASRPWDAALAAEPLESWELKLYKQLVAMHAVNGGELFGNPEEHE